MLYRFKSQATADTVMLQASGEQMLTLMGKEVAPQGIITVAQIPGAIAALQQAITDSEALEAQAAQAAEGQEPSNADGNITDPVRLRQRAAPLITMLKESAAEGKDVVWGV
jgi:cyclopropane-fatty-acyl-phospholipid synthase